MCFCAFCCCFFGSFAESLADPGITGDLPYGAGLAPCPQPSGRPWHRIPRAPSAHSDLLPALALSLLPPQLPALVTGEVSMVTVWGASGHPEPEGARAEKGRVSMPSQLFSGPQRDLSCGAWQVLEQLRSGWTLSFCDFFSYLLPAFCHVPPSPTVCL